MKKILVPFFLLLMLACAVDAKVNDKYMKTGDRLPYYTFEIVDSNDVAVDISADTITATVINLETDQKVVNNGTVNITDGANGRAELRWPDSSTNTAGVYAIEFKILSGGLQFTAPASYDAYVIIRERH